MKSNPLPTDIQVVFLCSKVNGDAHFGNLMPDCHHNIAFPRDTWLSRRLEALRKQKEAGESDET